MLLDFTSLNNGDTVEVPVMPDSTLIIFFRDKNLTIPHIYNRSDAKVIQKNPGQIEILLDKQLNKDIIQLDIGDGKTIFLKIRQSWILDGTFYFNDPFGTNNNPVRRAQCFFYEWNGAEFVQTQVDWTDSNGYFYFWTDKDTVAVLIQSASELSFVFYADDNCFDGSYWEQWPYHYFDVYAINYAHNNETIPVYYTTISDLSLAGAFHIQNIINHANNEIGYPNLHPRVPIYYNNLDSCITQSDFYGFTIANIPGIRIKGNVVSGDWDQWDSSVVLHELGHFYQHDIAQMAPNSAGSHAFYAPPSGSNVNDLSLAWQEGWATFFASVIKENSSYLDYGKPISDTIIGINLEKPSPDVPYYDKLKQTTPSSLVPYYEGAHVEGAVALSLWDLYDAIDDGNYLVSSQIWGHNNDYNGSEWWQGWDPIIDVFTNYDPQPDNPDHDY